MGNWFKGAIPPDAAAVADNLELWEQDERVSKMPFLCRALRRARDEIRQLLAQNQKLKDRVVQLEQENRRQF